MLRKTLTTLCRTLGAVCALAFAARAAQGANVLVTEMDLLSAVDRHGAIATRGDVTLALDGGYKYRAQLQLRYLNEDLEGTAGQLRFHAARAETGDPEEGLQLAYWTGYYDTLGKGEHYAGPYYHHDSPFDYQGYYPLYGTGMALSWNVGERGRAQTMVYQR